MDNLRRTIIEETEDDKVAQHLLLQLKLMQDRVTEREWALEDQLLRERTQ